jgi:hypothetical protein
MGRQPQQLGLLRQRRRALLLARHQEGWRRHSSVAAAVGGWARY